MTASSAEINQEESDSMAEAEAQGDEKIANGSNSNNDVRDADDGGTGGEEATSESSTEQELVVIEGKGVDGMATVEFQLDSPSESKDSYHVLHPREGGGLRRVQSHPFGAAVLLVFGASFLICWCCIIRYRRRSQTHRGKYAALHGSDDFFNGTFSDDLSIREKDSDEEFDDEYSYDSDDDIQRKVGIRLEMGGIHEMDANGGLTLDECNG